MMAIRISRQFLVRRQLWSGGDLGLAIGVCGHMGAERGHQDVRRRYYVPFVVFGVGHLSIRPPGG